MLFCSWATSHWHTLRIHSSFCFYLCSDAHARHLEEKNGRQTGEFGESSEEDAGESWEEKDEFTSLLECKNLAYSTNERTCTTILTYFLKLWNMVRDHSDDPQWAGEREMREPLHLRRPWETRKSPDEHGCGRTEGMRSGQEFPFSLTTCNPFQKWIRQVMPCLH